MILIFFIVNALHDLIYQIYCNKCSFFVFQGFTNLGYDDDKYSDYSDPSQTRPPNGQSWNPEDSKDTYAKITEQLDQEKRFEVDLYISY